MDVDFGIAASCDLHIERTVVRVTELVVAVWTQERVMVGLGFRSYVVGE
jgi:hypothetical protein